MKKNVLVAIYESSPAQILIALVINAFYAAVLGFSLVPSAWIVWASASRILGFGPGASAAARGLANLLGGAQASAPGFGAFVLLGLAGGAAVFTYFLWGALFQASLVRLLSLGIKPGRYPKVSLVTLRWLIYSGIYNISTRTVLPFIPVSWFITAYFRIVGAKIGRNVYINTPWLNDAYLLTLEEGVILGGNAEISWPSKVDINYWVERASDLTGTGWQPVLFTTALSELSETSDTLTQSTTNQFYRVKVKP